MLEFLGLILVLSVGSVTIHEMWNGLVVTIIPSLNSITYWQALELWMYLIFIRLLLELYLRAALDDKTKRKGK